MPTSREGVGAAAEGHALEGLASLHVAIVCAIDGARFVVVAANEPECLAQIAAYVAEQASLQLWPRSAAWIRELFTIGDVTAAIAEYFAGPASAGRLNGCTSSAFAHTRARPPSQARSPSQRESISPIPHAVETDRACTGRKRTLTEGDRDQLPV